jgi:hypothetical protein
MIKLITCSDDRSGRKGGLYGATQFTISGLLEGWIDYKHFRLPDFIDCDPMMTDTDAAKNGRVYKPWCIRQALSDMNVGDFLIYNDCSPEMWPDNIDLTRYDLKVIRQLTIANNDVLVGFVKWDNKRIGLGGLGIHTHENFTLDSCMEIMSGERHRHSFLCASGMICLRKTAFTVALIDNWWHYNRIKECACMNVDETEDSYYSGKPGRKLGNRHDQSVFSMLLNQADWSYCDIAYNDLSPYNFLNFCLPGHDYKFIKSNQ